jgi:hypothetical protein
MPLRAGVYRWWLQAWSPEGGYGEWGAENSFTVTTFAPTPAAPTGLISETQPTFQWYESAGASWYYLWLSDANGHVLDQWFEASNCAGGMCSVAPLALPPGDYRWWVQAWQAEGGYSPWSEESAFSIAGAAPEIVIPDVIEPTPEVIEPTPELIEPTAEAVEPTPEIATLEPTTEPTTEAVEPTPEVTESAGG